MKTQTMTNHATELGRIAAILDRLEVNVKRLEDRTSTSSSDMIKQAAAIIGMVGMILTPILGNIYGAVSENATRLETVEDRRIIEIKEQAKVFAKQQVYAEVIFNNFDKIEKKLSELEKRVK